MQRNTSQNIGSKLPRPGSEKTVMTIMSEESANPPDRRESYRFVVGRIFMMLLFVLIIFMGFLVDIYVLVIIIIAYVIVVAFTIKAFRTHSNRIVADKDVKSHFYFEGIKNGDPYEGIDYIISYIEDPQWDCPQTDIDKFLLYLAKRDDKFGQAAREKLYDRGD